MPPKQPPLPPPVGAGNRGRSNRPSPNKAVSEADKKSTRLTKGNQAAAATKRAKKATETAKGTAQEPLEVTDQDNPEANAEENEDMTNDVAALVGDEQEGPTKDPASDDSVQAMNSTDDDRAGSIINEAELPPADKDQERPTEAGALTKWILEVARASSGPGQWHDVGRILVKFPDVCLAMFIAHQYYINQLQIQRKAVLVKNIRGQYPTINRFRQNNVTGPLAQILLPDVSDRPCKRCSSNLGPFDTCVNDPDKKLFKGACANCQTVGEQAKCTLTENG